ncbi:hypothetical protein CRG98_015131 [Punica granatum]|uniref:Uncharacterized protein n=1 Tax=Punica granatum TaxID=22663 RepID=A0A2I0K7F5_PUNGR|nr:hypothetical protein CRG98_015131 [Punica granatum]
MASGDSFSRVSVARPREGGHSQAASRRLRACVPRRDEIRIASRAYTNSQQLQRFAILSQWLDEAFVSDRKIILGLCFRTRRRKARTVGSPRIPRQFHASRLMAALGLEKARLLGHLDVIGVGLLFHLLLVIISHHLPRFHLPLVTVLLHEAFTVLHCRPLVTAAHLHEVPVSLPWFSDSFGHFVNGSAVIVRLGCLLGLRPLGQFSSGRGVRNGPRAEWATVETSTVVGGLPGGRSAAMGRRDRRSLELPTYGGLGCGRFSRSRNIRCPGQSGCATGTLTSTLGVTYHFESVGGLGWLGCGSWTPGVSTPFWFTGSNREHPTKARVTIHGWADGRKHADPET